MILDHRLVEATCEPREDNWFRQNQAIAVIEAMRSVFSQLVMGGF